MLQFFRRYQKFFYVVVTFIVVVTFSFFGTYGAIDSQPIEREGFTTLQGNTVSARDLSDMTMFLSSDVGDFRDLGGRIGPNFLNDGALLRDIISKGLAPQIAEAFAEEVQQELQKKEAQERHYRPYAHPQAQFISALAAWNYFAPELITYLSAMNDSANDASERFVARAQLYEQQKLFSPNILRQLLLHQQNQYNWVEPDPQLPYQDLHLFGHRSAEDWFGRTYMEKVSQLIFNGAEIARARGYTVSKQEALADLMRTAAGAYQEVRGEAVVASLDTFLDEQLRRMTMDENRAASLWQEVLLFRRWMDEAAGAVFVDELLYQPLGEYAGDTVETTRFAMEDALQLATPEDLLRFEVYLDHVAADQVKEGVLELPTRFQSIAQLKQKAPELLQRRFTLSYRMADRNLLGAKVPIRDILRWQLDDANWQMLQQKEPELGLITAADEQARLDALDSLNKQAKRRVDALARRAILDENPDWVEAALADAEENTELVAFSLRGGRPVLPGVTDPKAFVAALDAAIEEAGEGATPSIRLQSGDGRYLYEITILSLGSEPEIVTYREAVTNGALDSLVTRVLESYYPIARQSKPERFQKADGTFLSFEEARPQLVEMWLQPLTEALYSDLLATSAIREIPDTPNAQFSAHHRFFPQLRTARDALTQGEAVDKWVLEQGAREEELADQWLLRAEPASTARHEARIGFEAAFDLAPGQYSPVRTGSKSEAFFYRVEQRSRKTIDDMLANKALEARELLGNEVRQELLAQLLEQMQLQKS